MAARWQKALTTCTAVNCLDLIADCRTGSDCDGDVIVSSSGDRCCSTSGIASLESSGDGTSLRRHSGGISES